MKKNHRVIDIINVLLFISILISFWSFRFVSLKEESFVISNKALTMYLTSELLDSKLEIEEEEEIIDSSEIKEEETKEESQEEVKEEQSIADTHKKEEEISAIEDAPMDVLEDHVQKEVLEVLTGSLAGYGPDCYGCTSNKTASGQYIGNGNIYYTDGEYGKVRIVAGDSKYPFGSIVKITNTGYEEDIIYAVVLDRGGGVGIGKKFLFDLLFVSEKEALAMGSRKNVTFEILRLGY